DYIVWADAYRLERDFREECDSFAAPGGLRAVPEAGLPAGASSVHGRIDAGAGHGSGQNITETDCASRRLMECGRIFPSRTNHHESCRWSDSGPIGFDAIAAQVAVVGNGQNAVAIYVGK